MQPISKVIYQPSPIFWFSNRRLCLRIRFRRTFQGRQVFVGGLGPDTDANDLRGIFGQIGAITYATVFKDLVSLWYFGVKWGNRPILNAKNNCGENHHLFGLTYATVFNKGLAILWCIRVHWGNLKWIYWFVWISTRWIRIGPNSGKSCCDKWLPSSP